MLQNPGLAFHPPTLYMGYVGFSVPFAFAIAALLTGRTGNEWVEATRRWTLVAWIALTTGILWGGLNWLIWIGPLILLLGGALLLTRHLRRRTRASPRSAAERPEPTEDPLGQLERLEP